MYTYAPANLTPTSCWANFYIRYEQNPLGRRGFRSTPYGAITKFPDRTIYYVYNPQHRPNAYSFDEHFNVSPFEPGSWTEQVGLTHCLISAERGIKENVRDMHYLHNSTKVLADSGGAQLKFGTEEYVDPGKMIAWMNHGAHIGMGLDLAPRPCDQGHRKVLKNLAKMTHTLTEFFLRNKRKDLKIESVAQGFSLEEYRTWCKYVQTDGTHGWAAGANSSNDLVNLRGLLVPIFEFSTEKQRKHHAYHLFGFSGRERTPALAWLGRYVQTLTTDSTSWITAARFRRYLTFNPTNGATEPIGVGDNVPEKERIRKGMHCPCNCPFCAKLGYLDYYALPSDAFSERSLSFHNLYVMVQQANFWNHAAQTADSVGEYLELVRWAFGNDPAIRTQVEYIEYVAHHGLDKAEQKFHRALAANALGGRLDMNPIFGKPLALPSGATVKNPENVNGVTASAGYYTELPSAQVVLDRYTGTDWSKMKAPLTAFEGKRPKRNAPLDPKTLSHIRAYNHLHRERSVP